MYRIHNVMSTAYMSPFTRKNKTFKWLNLKDDIS